MDAQRLDGHKKVLGILYIISATFIAFGLFLMNTILNLVFAFAFDEIEPDEQRVVEFIMSIIQFLPAFIILFYCIPTLIAGIGLLAKKTWATTLALIIGCFKLFSFPIGTAIGVYAIWIFSEDQKLAKTS